MDASEMGKRGAKITNSLLTAEIRSTAAKKGWKNRKQKSRWYVYHHIADGKVFYVGMGRFTRPFSTKGRNDLWKRFVKKLPGQQFDVKLVKSFAKEENAIHFEGEELDRLKPVANIDYKSAPSHMRYDTLVKKFGVKYARSRKGQLQGSNLKGNK